MLKRLTSEEIATCKSLGEKFAEKDIESLIAFLEGQKSSPEEVVALIFDDWVAFSQTATDTLVANRLIDAPYAFSNSHEKLLAFKLYTKSYERKIISLIKDRFK